MNDANSSGRCERKGASVLQFLCNFSATSLRSIFMPPTTVFVFPPFRLDRANERLWRDEQPIHLRPKTFAVLRCLLEHAGQLLTKTALLQTVWPETVVSEAVLLGCIRDLRRALNDDPKHPQFIETVHRRGYRFIGSITVTAESDAQREVSPHQTPARHTQVPGVSIAETSGTMVGREVELAALHRYCNTAWEGTRQVVFVTGRGRTGQDHVSRGMCCRSGAPGSLVDWAWAMCRTLRSG